MKLSLVVSSSLLAVVSAQNKANLDRFNYDTTVTADSHNDYGPKDWIKVRCPDSDTCLGYPDSFDPGVEWEFTENSCRWCPASNNAAGCNDHHQSPMNVQRGFAEATHPLHNECIDVHWMAYHDSTCTMEVLQENNAFTIERHALKIIQPVEHLGDDQYRIGCRSDLGRRWGKIDFSRGFSHWWHLSHIDLHLPSEHFQNGKRYDGELQMYHFYSVSGEEAGVNNEMGTVTFFLQSYDDTEDYDTLNRVICQWRKAEEETREACGLPSVTTEYPGCYFYTRGQEVQPAQGARHLRNSTTVHEKKAYRPRPMSAHDIILHNAMNPDQKKVIEMSEEDYQTEDDFDWDAFIQEQYDNERNMHKRRKLMNYDHAGPWFNYWPLIGVKTEYYYRYSGTQTVPPCYGRFEPGNNRAQTNNWRVMKDPIRISKRQLAELHRLLRERIAPPDDPLVACEPDTAAKVDPVTGLVDVARPLQANHKAHHAVFCECINWGSKWEEDRNWCREFRNDIKGRFYDHPYNFKTDGF